MHIVDAAMRSTLSQYRGTQHSGPSITTLTLVGRLQDSYRDGEFGTVPDVTGSRLHTVLRSHPAQGCEIWAEGRGGRGHLGTSSRCGNAAQIS